MRRLFWVLILRGASAAAILFSLSAAAAPGSWSVRVAAPQPAVAGRLYRSAAALPPPEAAGQFIHSVAWRWRAAAPLRAWLCRGEDCVPLHETRGRGDFFVGRPADQPLYFRFRLPRGESRAVAITGLSLAVEYRPAGGEP